MIYKVLTLFSELGNIIPPYNCWILDKVFCVVLYNVEDQPQSLLQVTYCSLTLNHTPSCEIGLLHPGITLISYTSLIFWKADLQCFSEDLHYNRNTKHS